MASRRGKGSHPSDLKDPEDLLFGPRGDPFAFRDLFVVALAVAEDVLRQATLVQREPSVSSLEAKRPVEDVIAYSRSISIRTG